MADTFQKIASATVGAGGAATITLSSIPSTYTDLVVRYSLRSARAVTFTQLGIRLNGSAVNYTTRILSGTGSTVASTNNTTAYLGYESSSMNAANSTTLTFTNGEIYLPNYSGNDGKTANIDFVAENNATAGNTILSAAIWSEITAISSITFNEPNGNSNFDQYSTVTLYGILKA